MPARNTCIRKCCVPARNTCVRRCCVPARNTCIHSYLTLLRCVLLEQTVCCAVVNAVCLLEIPEMKSPHFRVSFPTQKKGGGLAAGCGSLFSAYSTTCQAGTHTQVEFPVVDTEINRRRERRRNPLKNAECYPQDLADGCT